MVDLHTHLLASVDDGAASITEASAMIEALVSQDIDTVVCTPHFNPDLLGMEEFINKRNEAIDSISSEKLKLIPGSETMLCESLFYYSDLHPLCIGNTNYLLIEMPLAMFRNRHMFLTIDKLIRSYGLNPVIAHVERYSGVKVGWIKRLSRMGCLLQINAGSLIGRSNRRRVLKYLKRGLIDVMSSDCHNMNDRKPNLAEGYRILEGSFNKSLIDQLKENAENMVKGVLIKPESDYLIL